MGKDFGPVLLKRAQQAGRMAAVAAACEPAPLLESTARTETQVSTAQTEMLPTPLTPTAQMETQEPTPMRPQQQQQPWH